MKLSLSLTALLVLHTLYVYPAQSQTSITALKTEYMETPIGIDVAQPRFSWQMTAPGNQKGKFQTAYQLDVKDEAGTSVWNSYRVSSDASLGIPYAGPPLKATTRYSWSVTVWDQDGNQSTATSWFETGLMNPDESAWQGATWIGGGDDDQVLYSDYLSVFKINYTLQLDRESDTNRASFILGANDPRLMDANKNLFGLENGPNESYVALEVDVSAVDGTDDGLAVLNVYRVGYHPDDSRTQPLLSYPISSSIINSANQYEPHTVYLNAVFGLIEVFIDGRDDAHKVTAVENAGSFGPPGVNINPMGSGGDYISFPMLADIGFSVPAEQTARFSNLQIRHYRQPSNPIFNEALSTSTAYKGIFASKKGTGLFIESGSYVIDGAGSGTFFVANPGKNAMPMLRTEFNVEDKPVRKARLYVTSRGIYEMQLNGQHVGEDYFNPGLTQYNVTHMYQTYDITDLISRGETNAVGAQLGEGWWSGNITFTGSNWNFFGDRQSLLSLLVVTYEDGTTTAVHSSPESWRYYNNGPVRYASFFQGEVYDATREAAIAGWSSAGYDDRLWKAAVNVPLQGTTYQTDSFTYDRLSLIGQQGRNAGVVLTLTAQRMNEVRPGVFVYDMGQNMVGIPEITLPDSQTGQQITLRYSEVTYPDLEEHRDDSGMIMLENIRAAHAQDVFILKGGAATLSPRFTFHGYRYIEITGLDEVLPLEAVQGLVISSIPELASRYETSNPKVNRLWENITWSMRGNFLSIPTDTPARNERMGWGGDISVFSRSSTYLANAGPFLRRHMLAMRDIQRPDGRFTDVAPVGGGFGGILWGSAGLTVAWEAYRQYGDVAMLAEHYDAMDSYMSYLETRIDSASGIITEGPLGDWLSPENSKNDNTLLWDAYYVFNLDIMTRVAAVLGKRTEATRYQGLYNERKRHFNATHVNPATGKTIATGLQTFSFGGPPPEAGSLVDTQVSYAVPLALGVFNEQNARRAADHLVAAVERNNVDDLGIQRPPYSLMTGFIGTAWISKALSDYGYNDAAYRLLQQTSYPSWLYPVDQGATTIWERLNSYTIEDGFGGNNSMNSFNHYSFGAVGAWMYNYSLGIQRDDELPAFKEFSLKPTPDPNGRMTWARGYYDSMYGRIESGWRIEENQVVYTFSVPPNTLATLHLPATDATEVEENGNPDSPGAGVSLIREEQDHVVYTLVSGDYRFVVPVQE